MNAVLAQAVCTVWDDVGNVVGYGLTLRETSHVFKVDGRRLYTWCAFDTLFFAILIDRTARVTSRCASSRPRRTPASRSCGWRYPAPRQEYIRQPAQGHRRGRAAGVICLVVHTRAARVLFAALMFCLKTMMSRGTVARMSVACAGCRHAMIALLTSAPSRRACEQGSTPNRRSNGCHSWSAHIARMAQRIAAGLWPDSEPMRLHADRNRPDGTRCRVDRVDHVVVPAG
ncbi:hypothetical protein DBB29_00190 [Pandoraea cepalis]|uniref:Uncharacterized protein n=1 Tax=Pandoraea cepalis TaxID=2508294 RepID=A0AAW7MG36_9BURK|nr:hypothetical protein [Pandoraea cepalis]MDN4576558.1 hypothetical protein [Pandoraea cepalis]